MLENRNGSLDVQFSKDIHWIAESLSTISQSLAVIAGTLERDGGKRHIQPLPAERYQKVSDGCGNTSGLAVDTRKEQMVK